MVQEAPTLFSTSTGWPQASCSFWPMVQKLSDEVNRILRLPDVTAKIEALGLQVGGGKPEEFQKTLHTDAAIYAKIIKEGNIRVAQ